MPTRDQEFRIVRLQIQTGPMKVGSAPWRRYRTDGLQEVDRLHISERGSRGEWSNQTPEPVDGHRPEPHRPEPVEGHPPEPHRPEPVEGRRPEPVEGRRPEPVEGRRPEPVEGLDVHHRDHPSSRDRKGKAGLTVMGTGDYLQLRERYGPHLVDGAAGESVLVDAPQGLAEIDFPDEFGIRTTAGMITFRLGRVADPCVEFSRFCLGEPPSDAVSDAVRKALVDLDRGHRGYRAAAAGSGTIRRGDVLVLPANR